MTGIPAFTWVVDIAAVTGLLAALCTALYASAIAAGTGRAIATRLAAGTGVLLGAWLLAAAALADAGVFRQAPNEAVPWIGVAIAGSLTVWLLAARLPAVSAALADPAATARLAAVQSFRVVGVVFLVLMVLGHLPAAFALPAGLGDVAVGIAAPFVAARLARRPDRRTGAVWFNLLGLFDLIVAVSIGFLAAPGPFRLLELTPSTEPMTLFPLALIPTVAVPLAVALHLVSLRRLAVRVGAPSERPVSSPVSAAH